MMVMMMIMYHLNTLCSSRSMHRHNQQQHATPAMPGTGEHASCTATTVISSSSKPAYLCSSPWIQEVNCALGEGAALLCADLQMQQVTRTVCVCVLVTLVLYDQVTSAV